MFAKRMQQLESSGIRKLFELGLQMKNPIDLSLGQPDFDVPPSVKAAAIRAIEQGRNRYTPTAGLPELRAALAQKLRGEGISIADNVMVTSGASGGLILALMTLADESCDVYMPDPYFVSYPQMIRLAGATAVPVDTYPTFKLTPATLEKAVHERTEELRGEARRKILLFNTPANPTGVAYLPGELEALAKKARELGFQVISDEVYDTFSYDGEHVSWLKYDPSAVLIRAFSKTGGMPGWRIGYAAAPEPVLAQMLKLQQFTFVCINTPAQVAAVELLKTDFSEMVAEYRKRRDLLCDLMKGEFDLVRPTGSFYAFPAFPVGQAEEFMKKCLEKEILVVPGNTFSRRNTNFRISFSVSPAVLEKGIRALIDIRRS